MRKVRLQVNREIPISDSQRGCTDMWWLLVPIFCLGFFIYCMMVFNAQYVRQLSGPADGTGVVCGYGALYYPYLYVANPLKIHKRICVKTCPFNITKITGIRYNFTKGTTKIGSKAVELQNQHPFLAQMNADKIYDSVPFDTIRGGFCLPIDVMLRDQLAMNTNMTWCMGFLANFSFVWVLIGFAIVLCGIYIALLLYYPKTMDIVMPILGGFLISTFGVNLVFYTTRFEIGFNRVMFGLLLFVFGALMLLCCWLYKKQLKSHGMFLEHAGKLIKSRMNILAHIFIFIVLSLLLLGICFYQFLAVWTTLPPTFIISEMYYVANSYFSYFFTAIIFFQVWWGLNFLKQAFNYTVSSISADWYFNQSVTRGLFTPYFRLIRYHLGSIYYSSFVSALFQPLSFIQSITSPRQMTIRVDRSCSAIWMPCMRFLNFVRPDALVILDITGRPYKECVMYRNQLCQDLSLYRDIHVASRLFRIGSYGFICGFIGYFALYVRYTMVMSALTMLFFFLLMISMYFVGIYADVAEALNILFLADEYRSERGFLNLVETPQGLTQVYNPQHKVIQSVDHPLNRPIYNAINQQIARKGNSDVQELGHITGEVDIHPNSRISGGRYNPSTMSQRIENQLGYNFKSMGETRLR